MSDKIRKVVKSVLREIGDEPPADKYGASEGVNQSLKQVRSFLRNEGKRLGEDLFRFGRYKVSLEEMSMGSGEKEFYITFFSKDAYETYEDPQALATVEFSPLDWPEVKVQFKAVSRGMARSPKTEKIQYNSPYELFRFVVNRLGDVNESKKVRKEEKIRKIIREEIRNLLVN